MSTVFKLPPYSRIRVAAVRIGVNIRKGILCPVFAVTTVATYSNFILKELDMNDREKFLFDLEGFLVIRDFLTKEEVNALNAAIDANMDKKGEDGNSYTGNSKPLVGTHKRGFFSGMLTWPKPWCKPYRDIIAHPKAIPYLNTIHGRGWRLDHEPFILTADKDSEGLMLHGSTDHHFDGSQYYTYRNGEIRCGMVVFQYQLADVNEGDCGLCVIPGSHNAN